jgi:hypothetical protein
MVTPEDQPMAKIEKTAAEIEALVMEAALKISECEGLTGVTIQQIVDERVPYNWSVSYAHNSPTRYCETAIETIVDGMQRVIDLKS